MSKFISDLFPCSRLVHSVLLVFSLHFVSGQDTLTIERLDFKFLELQDGVISPLTELQNSSVAGFFLPCGKDVMIEFCNPSDLSIWVDGRFFGKMKNRCDYYSSFDLCKISERDTVYVNLVSEIGLSSVAARSLEISSESVFRYPDMRSPAGNVYFMGYILGFFALVFVWRSEPIRLNELLRPSREPFSLRLWSLPYLLMVGVIFLFMSFIWANDQGMIIALPVLLYIAMKELMYKLGGALFVFSQVSQKQAAVHTSYWFLVVNLIFIFSFLDSIPSVGIHLLNIQPVDFVLVAIIAFIPYQIFILSSQKLSFSLHSFIYLCTTEILPAIVAFRWFLK